MTRPEKIEQLEEVNKLLQEFIDSYLHGIHMLSNSIIILHDLSKELNPVVEESVQLNNMSNSLDNYTNIDLPKCSNIADYIIDIEGIIASFKEVRGLMISKLARLDEIDRLLEDLYWDEHNYANAELILMLEDEKEELKAKMEEN